MSSRKTVIGNWRDHAFGAKRLGLGVVGRGGVHLVATCGQRERGIASDAAARTGDQDRFGGSVHSTYTRARRPIEDQ
jgi:hypothetical protein